MDHLQITYPAELPVSERRQDIMNAIRDHQVVVIAGATGSGKTTQLPKMCLELGRSSIAHTQPRRIAARAVAERIAEELKVELGGLVGYQVRFTDKAGPNTKVKVMTDGILLNAIQRHRNLEPYDTIIIDEAHERSLNIDFLLGYLKQLLPKRPDLKVIITSATIDPQSFSKHFDDAPIIEVSGRTFEIEIRNRPIGREAAEDEDPDESSTGRDYLDGIVDALDELVKEPAGDILVFLSGESEIRDAQETIEGRIVSGALGKGTEVLPLFGRLSAAEQHRVFESSKLPGIQRRIVLATNVAETSLTIPNIKYVIDCGTARISRYSPAAKVQRLPIEAISKASANQRAGRAGRTSSGIVIRLYSEDDYEAKSEFTDPEILRTNLASVILQAAQLGLGDITKFPFLQPPNSKGVRDGLSLLAELGCLKDPKSKTVELTEIGRNLARLPIEPRFGRMLLESKNNDLVREVMIIVTGLTVQDPRERPLANRAKADAAHARFTDPTSDFLTLLNLWNHLEQQQKSLSSSAFRRLCKAEFLNYMRVREWQDLLRQISSIAKPLGIVAGKAKVDPDGIHKSLLAGLLSQIGLKQSADKKANEYLGSNAKKFVVFPGSALAKKPPAAMMSAELVETSRLFARMNAAINPEWAEALGGDLCKRSFSEPHWSKAQGSVLAYERVMLLGVPIVVSRRMQYSRINQDVCRELFIKHALVLGEWDSKQAFDRANRALLAELEELAEKSVKPVFAPDDEDVYRFYAARIPKEVFSTRNFEGWWRKTRVENSDLLTMTREDFLPPEINQGAELPAAWRFGDSSFNLEYRFEPGHQQDGATVTIGIDQLDSLVQDPFEWLVPAMREDLIAELIRGLPKNLRRAVVPAADWAKKFLNAVPEHPTDPLLETVAKTLRSLSGKHMVASDFNLDALPTSLRMSYRVADAANKTLAIGLDLNELKQRLVAKPTEAIIEKPNYAALRAEAARQRAELARGIVSQVASPATYVAEHLASEEKLALVALGYQNVQAFVADVLLAMVQSEISETAIESVDQTAVAAKVSQLLIDESFRCAKLLVQISASSREASKAITLVDDRSLLFVLAKQKNHIADLLQKPLISSTTISRLARLPIYLQANLLRTQKLLQDSERDRIAELQLDEALLLFQNAGGSIPLRQPAPANIEAARWSLEEFRVSLFAQTLGAAEAVSLQRIKKALSASER